MKTLPAAVRAALATTLTAVGLTASLAAQTASAGDIEALREQIRLLDQKLRVLERNQELKDETAAAEAKKQPKITAGDGRFEITSADGANSLRLRGLVQADARFYLDDANATGNNDSFILRRARIIFEGKFANNFQYVVQPEYGGTSFSLLDTYVNTVISPGLQLRVGKFKVPVGLEQLQSDPVAFFNERSVATNLTPNRDLGVQLHGDLFDSRLNYAVGVFNGQPDGGSSNNGSDVDSDKTVAARLFATPFVKNKDSALKGLGFGIAASQGNYDGTSARTGGYRTDGQQTFFAYESSTLADGKGTVYSPQAYYYYGPLGILAEYVSSTIDVRRNAASPVREIENKAYNFSVGYVLTGEDASYKGVTPKSNFNLAAGTWGAFEVVARVASLDIDDQAFTGGAAARLANPNVSATEVTTYGLGLNWYLSKAVRAGFNVFKNDFKLTPGAVVPANSVVSDDELAIVTRFQVSF